MRRKAQPWVINPKQIEQIKPSGAKDRFKVTHKEYNWLTRSPRIKRDPNEQMKHVNFKFPEPKKGIVVCDFTVDALDEVEAVGKLNDYLTELKKLFFRPPAPVGDSNDPKVIGQECMSRLRAITDPTAFIVTLHLFTEQLKERIQNATTQTREKQSG